MAIFDRIRGWFGVRPQSRTATGALATNEPPTFGVRDTGHYQKLEAYFRNVRVYEALNEHIRHTKDGVAYSALKSLRNPAQAAVEFHSSVIWGGRPSELELEGKSPVTDAVKKVWKWSNLDERGKVMGRRFPLHGDIFLKVAKPDGRERVEMQAIDAKHVTDFDKDDRGHFTYLRLDIPSEERNDEGKVKPYLYTEVWRKGKAAGDGDEAGGKADGYMRYWKRDKDASVEDSEERMGDPTGGLVLSESGNPDEAGVLGFDFIPVVHAKFRDIGDARGIGVFTPHVEDIDEACRIATRLHEMFFRYDRPYKALKSVGQDATGAPMPAPRVDVASRREQQQGYSQAGYDTEPSRPDEVELGGEKTTLLPANAELQDTTPNVDYGSGIQMLANQLGWLAEQLPELLYYRIHDKGEMSGRALRTILAGAIDRAKEARENLEAAIVRADEMALTIGKLHRLEGFTELGDYESGDLEHSFTERPVLPESENEKAARESAEADVLLKYRQLGADVGKLFKYADLTDIAPEKQEAGTGGEEPDNEALGAARRILEQVSGGAGNGANGGAGGTDANPADDGDAAAE